MKTMVSTQVYAKVYYIYLERKFAFKGVHLMHNNEYGLIFIRPTHLLAKFLKNVYILMYQLNDLLKNVKQYNMLIFIRKKMKYIHC